MLFCNNCGQCELISGDYFYELRYTSGWERNLVDHNGCDTVEWCDSEVTDSEHDAYECPNCDSQDINTDWDGTEEEAERIRDFYERRRQQSERERLEEQHRRMIERQAKDPKREWDVIENVV